MDSQKSEANIPLWERRCGRRLSQGILRSNSCRDRSISPADISKNLLPLCNVEPSSPQPSVDRLSVTFADDIRDTSQMDKSTQNKKAIDEDEEEGYSASVNIILERKESCKKRRTSSPAIPGAARRSSSVFTNSSGETGISMEESEGEILMKLRLHKEVVQNVKYQPWPMERKLRLINQAKAYIRRHEGELQERLANSRSTRDMLTRANIFIINFWQDLKRDMSNLANVLIPWELRIKEIESHFGSAVASYFTFLRWLFWVNLVTAIILIIFIVVPEELIYYEKKGDRKTMLDSDEAKNSTKLLTLWNFEGILKYSPIFYGYYNSQKEEIKWFKYSLPLAYFVAGVAAYIYAFVAILKKMAKNSRQSKLSEKEDECAFSWKIFTGWDFMIGNPETAHNRTASIILGFKEALLEEAERNRHDNRNWKMVSQRVVGHLNIIFLLATSVYAVVKVVDIGEEQVQQSWWSQYQVTFVITFIGWLYPIIFDMHSIFEKYHPRKALRIQLARIMALNLLNIYSFTFATFSKIHKITKRLSTLKTVLPSTSTNRSTCLFDKSSFPKQIASALSSLALLSSSKTYSPLPTSTETYQMTITTPISLTESTPGYITESSKPITSIPGILTTVDNILTSGNFETTNSSSSNLNPNNYLRKNNADISMNGYNDEFGTKRSGISTISEVFSTTSDVIGQIDISTPTEVMFELENVTTAVSIEDSKINDGNDYRNSFWTTANESDISTSSDIIPTNSNYVSEQTDISIQTKTTLEIKNTITTANSLRDNKTYDSKNNFSDNSEGTNTKFEILTDAGVTLTTSNDITEPVKFLPTSMSEVKKTETAASSTSLATEQSNSKTDGLNVNYTPSSGLIINSMSSITVTSSSATPPTTSTYIGLCSADDEGKIIETADLECDVRRELRTLCWETMFGQELVKLTIMDLMMTMASIFLTDFFRAIFVRGMNKYWCWDLEKRFPQYGDFKIAENILHLVNNQGMVWMGMFFSPGLPLINLIKLIIIMYLRSWAVLTCNIPHQVVFRASRSNNFYFGLLLTMLFLCVLPVSYAIVRLEPSWHCGPFSQCKRMYHVFTTSLKKLIPRQFHDAMDYIASPGIVIPLLIFLTLIIFYLISLTGALREANADLKIQLRRERTEERRKMFQIVGKKNKSESAEQTFAKWRKILPSQKLSVSSQQDSNDFSDVNNAENKSKELIARFLKEAIRRKSSVASEEEENIPTKLDKTSTSVSPAPLAKVTFMDEDKRKYRQHSNGGDSDKIKKSNIGLSGHGLEMSEIPQITISEVNASSRTGSESNLSSQSRSTDTIIAVDSLSSKHSDKNDTNGNQPKQSRVKNKDTQNVKDDFDESISSESETYDSITQSIRDIHKLTKLHKGANSS